MHDNGSDGFELNRPLKAKREPVGTIPAPAMQSSITLLIIPVLFDHRYVIMTSSVMDSPFSPHWGLNCICQHVGNGAMPPFANNNSSNPPSGAPRDPAFGGIGRPNGRSPGNGAPPVTAAGPPTAAKSSVTISNGRDPRRAKRWNWESWEIMGKLWPPTTTPFFFLLFFFISPGFPSQPISTFRVTNEIWDYLHHFFLQAKSRICCSSCVKCDCDQPLDSLRRQLTVRGWVVISPLSLHPCPLNHTTNCQSSASAPPLKKKKHSLSKPPPHWCSFKLYTLLEHLMHFLLLIYVWAKMPVIKIKKSVSAF